MESEEVGKSVSNQSYNIKVGAYVIPWENGWSSALLGESVRDEFGRNELGCGDHEDFYLSC